ncbi:MAG: YdeI/OmpD-associated family protein [Myxococcaceae bacterium]|nr:YdeI/OmpD-associated family protein [Myxococcaceae bacterium]
MKAGAPRKTAPRKAPTEEPPILSFAQPRAWANWLASHHPSSRGVWLKFAKKGSGIASISYPEALEQALAWGWIDGQKKSLDDTSWLQKFTPRGPRSIWSWINREKALALIAAGKMKPAGLAEVERAKQDGRWEVAYAPQSRAAVPDDLSAALAANARAAGFFATLDSKNRYAVLFRIHQAKKAETRARRIAQFVEMLARNEKLYP